MVDEYALLPPSFQRANTRSDSSMVDEYDEVSINGSIHGRSDSSMVDEYQSVNIPRPILRRVQIPLWSMNTTHTFPKRLYL